ITFFDNAWEYWWWRSEEWLGRAVKGKREKVFLMTKVCTHGRSAALGMKMLEESLRHEPAGRRHHQRHRRPGSVATEPGGGAGFHAAGGEGNAGPPRPLRCARRGRALGAV